MLSYSVAGNAFYCKMEASLAFFTPMSARLCQRACVSAPVSARLCQRACVSAACVSVPVSLHLVQARIHRRAC